MKNSTGRGLLHIAIAPVFLLIAAAAQAQQSSGTPTATTSVEVKALPAFAPEFGGVTNMTAKESKPCWPPTLVPPKGAPNVLLIMTDDQGYGVSGTFGGVKAPTPSEVPTPWGFPPGVAMPKNPRNITQFIDLALVSKTK
jgi:hypothetical protein